MEESSTALDCLLILFYINMKHMLKTKQLAEKVFLEQMVKHCKENGFPNYSAKEIKCVWKKLVSKYMYLKSEGTNEDREKWKYFEILDSCFEESDFHKEKPSKFSEASTALLIECFTNKKITCIIQGYESDQVLNEIRSTCRSLGVFLSKDDIKDKWKSLTNIYKFLIDRGKTNNTWLHFKAMRYHYQDNFWNKPTRTKDVKGESKPRRLRQRSKSVGSDLKKNGVEGQDKAYPVIYEERKAKKRNASKRNTSKRLFKDTGDLLDKRFRDSDGKDVDLKADLCENGVSQVPCSEGSVNVTPTSKIRVINIDHSDICQKSGNFTINLPSITKKFSDNEFLPLKKRLRVDGDDSGKCFVASSEIGDEYLGLSVSNVEDIQSHLALVGGTDCAHEHQSGDYLEHQKVPKELEKNLSVFNCADASVTEKSPIVLIIKVDDRGNPVNLKETETLAMGNQPDASRDRNVVPESADANADGKIESDSFNEKTKTSRNENRNPLSNCHSVDSLHCENEHVNDSNGKHQTENNEVNSPHTLNNNVDSACDQTDHKKEEPENREDFVFRKPFAVDKVASSDSPDTQTEKQTSNSKYRLPVKVGGKLKEIFISQSDLKKIERLAPKTNCSNLNNTNTPSANPPVNSPAAGIKFLSQVVKPAIAESATPLPNNNKIEESFYSAMHNPEISLQSLESDLCPVGNDCVFNGNQRVEECENESLISEAVGDHDGLKDNLLATVIDFQEQNNQEFIEIKNLMKQNNLLQRETNRLLRLILEKW